MYRVLQVDQIGTPQQWLSLEDAASEIYRGNVAWTIGPTVSVLHGGFNRQGVQSIVEVPAILGTSGQAPMNLASSVPSLGRHNHKLFERDKHLCAYCGRVFHEDELTRDHVMPLSRGGRDKWSNVVSACHRCNTHKGAKTPEEANMPLLYVPYTPNWFEDFILRQGPRKILADQMEFLLARVSSHSRFKQQA